MPAEARWHHDMNPNNTELETWNVLKSWKSNEQKQRHDTRLEHTVIIALWIWFISKLHFQNQSANSCCALVWICQPIFILRSFSNTVHTTATVSSAEWSKTRANSHIWYSTVPAASSTTRMKWQLSSVIVPVEEASMERGIESIWRRIYFQPASWYTFKMSIGLQ
jgi:hypothetical protein